MNINSYLREISAKLLVKDEEKEKIQKSIDTLAWRLKSYFTNQEEFKILDVIVFGSYSRGTNLPRSIDDDSDVDIMVVFEKDGSVPQTFLDRIRRTVEYWYKSSEIKQSSPTIVLDMTHIKIEITPAILEYGVYYIKSDNKWMPTYALTDFDNLTFANKNNRFDIKPIIRLIKYWNVNVDNKYCSSYEIEKSIVPLSLNLIEQEKTLLRIECFKLLDLLKKRLAIL